MTDKDPVVAKDEAELQEIDEEIREARQHLKEITHEGERHFIDEGTEDRQDIDNTIVPPG